MVLGLLEYPHGKYATGLFETTCQNAADMSKSTEMRFDFATARHDQNTQKLWLDKFTGFGRDPIRKATSSCVQVIIETGV